MKKYKFYGNGVCLTDRCGFTPRDYYDLLSDVWCEKTCAPRMRECWSEGNKTCGQCSITSFLMQDLFGGNVLGVPLGDGNFHCFNVVDGKAFDLTSEQFGGVTLNYEDCPEQSRDVHFAKEEKRERYEYLREKLLEAREKAMGQRTNNGSDKN